MFRRTKSWMEKGVTYPKVACFPGRLTTEEQEDGAMIIVDNLGRVKGM